jgi:hypothetical protein
VAGFVLYTFENEQQKENAESVPALGEKIRELSAPDWEVICRTGATTPLAEAT